MDNKGIDFVAEEQGKIIYVQVVYLLTDKKQGWAFGNMLQIEDNFLKFAVSMDEINMSQKRIIHLHIKDFLLNRW